MRDLTIPRAEYVTIFCARKAKITPVEVYITQKVRARLSRKLANRNHWAGSRSRAIDPIRRIFSLLFTHFTPCGKDPFVPRTNAQSNEYENNTKWKERMGLPMPFVKELGGFLLSHCLQ